MARGERFAFLDVVRGIAVIWMIQVHVTNVLLDSALRTSWFFEVLNISNGFVAPAFIFCAGAGLWIALSRKGDEYRKGGRGLWMYLRRLGYILFLAYSMHAPIFSLTAMLGETSEVWSRWLLLDVLHAIVYSSLLALLVFLLSRSLKQATVLFGVIALFILGFSWTVVDSQPVAWSPFPMLPWSGYLFAGAWWTGSFMQSDNRERFAKMSFIFGLAIPVLVFIVKQVPLEMPWDAIWWKSSPGMHAFRISGPVVLMGALFALEERLRSKPIGRVLQTIGNESLFMYVGHLYLVYGPLAMLMSSLLGTPAHGYGVVALVWIAVTALFIAIMARWHAIKASNPKWAQRIVFLYALSIVVAFIFLPS